jgi:hypothetical protein
MTWEKKGLLLSPDSQIEWMQTSLGASFLEVDSQKLYITGRNSKNESQIGVADIEIDNEGNLCVSRVIERPILSIGAPGTFDESGVSYPWLVEDQSGNGDIHLFYVGWVAGTKTRFQNFAGHAISDDGGESFRRTSPSPIFDRTVAEPFGSGSCCVYAVKDRYIMLYTSFRGWLHDGLKYEPTYEIRLAYSHDLHTWIRENKTVISAGPSEHLVGVPRVLLKGDVYELWFCARGTSYRIFNAKSDDGINFERESYSPCLGVSESGWDSDMVEYAQVASMDMSEIMIYNGNGFGRTGIGWAHRKAQN